MGLMDLALNIPILALDNFWTFGKFYSRGFSHGSSEAKKGFWNKIKESNRLFGESENPLRRVMTDAEGNYVWNTITNKRVIGKGLLTGLREGNEELAQAWASEYSADQFSDTPDTYYKAVTDPDTERESLGFLQSVSQSFMNTYGNGDRWEEFAIGALTGLLGMPTFGRTANSDANTYLGRGKMVGFTGGLFGERSVAKELNSRGAAHVTAMNQLKKDIENGKKNLMLRKAFIDAMDGWATEGDKFEFKNAEDNDIFRQINAFLSTGRQQDLYDILSVDFEGMSRGLLENIARTTSPQDYGTQDLLDRETEDESASKKDTSGWRDATGNYLTATEEGVEVMRNKLIEKREALKEDLKRYNEALETVRGISNTAVRQSEDEVTELAWLLWKTNKFTSRLHDIKKSRSEDFINLDAALQDYQKTLESILQKPERSTDGMGYERGLEMEAVNTISRKNKQKALDNMQYVSKVRNLLKAISEAKDSEMP